MTGFRCTVAHTPGEIAGAQRVRWIVYGEEERLLSPAAGPGGREIDARDQDGDAIHLVVHADDEPVGTIRLLPGRAAHGEASVGRPGALGLDLESRFDLAPHATPGVVPGEVTRYCVLRRYRCTPVARMLYFALAAESRRLGITHWFAAANMETDSAADAALVYELVSARKLVDPRFRAVPRPPASCHRPSSPDSRRCYTDEERRQAHEGNIAGLRPPRAIALFMASMGARCIGAPAYDPYFNVFALPIVADVPAEAPALSADVGGAPPKRWSPAPPPPARPLPEGRRVG